MKLVLWPEPLVMEILMRLQPMIRAVNLGFGSGVSMGEETLADKSFENSQQLANLQKAQTDAGAMLINPEEAKKKARGRRKQNVN